MMLALQSCRYDDPHVVYGRSGRQELEQSALVHFLIPFDSCDVSNHADAERQSCPAQVKPAVSSLPLA